MGCSVSHSRRKEKGWSYLEDTLVAGEGLGEDRRDGAAARPVVSARERKREEKSPYAREKGKVKQTSQREEKNRSERLGPERESCQ